MLVLSRRANEVICIGDDVTITVVEIRGDKVRLGIDAPASVSVHRQEVYETVRACREAEYIRWAFLQGFIGVAKVAEMLQITVNAGKDVTADWQRSVRGTSK